MSVTWLGRQIWQYPLDAWLIQEVVSTLRPDLIIETGTYRGGSAFFFASLCDLLDHGSVISVDIDARETIEHPRISYIEGSSVDPSIVGQVADRVAETGSEKILLVLDSLHTAEHVLQELEMYAPLVPMGSYIHVQDGCLDELPMFRQAPPGPVVAVREFLALNSEFTRALDIESRYFMTGHPHGWLRRESVGAERRNATAQPQGREASNQPA